jgi:hypothetical protein
MRRKAVGDGWIGGVERGQSCNEEEAAGEKRERRQIAKAVARKDGWFCIGLIGHGHRSDTGSCYTAKPPIAELPCGEFSGAKLLSQGGGGRRRMAGRNRGRERTIDEGHLGVLSFQTR